MTGATDVILRTVSLTLRLMSAFPSLLLILIHVSNQNSDMFIPVYPNPNM